MCFCIIGQGPDIRLRCICLWQSWQPEARGAFEAFEDDCQGEAENLGPRGAVQGTGSRFLSTT